MQLRISIRVLVRLSVGLSVRPYLLSNDQKILFLSDFFPLIKRTSCFSQQVTIGDSGKTGQLLLGLIKKIISIIYFSWYSGQSFGGFSCVFQLDVRLNRLLFRRIWRKRHRNVLQRSGGQKYLLSRQGESTQSW